MPFFSDSTEAGTNPHSPLGMPPPTPVSAENAVADIVRLNSEAAAFWSRAHGWAPQDAADLLSAARLDWQVSLSHTLHLWTIPPPPERLAGHLVLGWTNLGSLVEGTLKLFLTVYLLDYRKSSDRPGRSAKLPNPGDLWLGQLRKFYSEHIFDDSWPWNDWVQSVQTHRNAIHTFNAAELGTHEDLLAGILTYRDFLSDLLSSCPEP